MKTYNLCHRLSNRWLYLVGTLVIAVAFGTALYLQYVLHQDPCPLCMIQRFIFIAMFILFAVAALHNPGRRGAKAYAVLISLLAISGVGTASRHIWLQHLPKDQVPACGPGLEYMLGNFPLAEVWQELMHGSGECAAKGWAFLGLGIPEWSLMLYVLLGMWVAMIVFRRPA